MPHDTDWEDEYLTIVGVVLMSLAALAVIAVLVWAVR